MNNQSTLAPPRQAKRKRVNEWEKVNLARLSAEEHINDLLSQKK